MASPSQFKRDFGEILRRVGDRADLVVRKSAMELGKSVILKSPVDTGRFRANWQFGAGMVNPDISMPPDTTGGSSLSRIAVGLSHWRAGDTIYLTNSLPYARRLEYGWSKQAPGGMVRLTVMEFQNKISAMLNETK